MRFGTLRIAVICFTMCLLGSVFSPIFIDLPNADAVPVIIDDEYEGSWTDNFNDTSGVENSDNLTIETCNVRLSTYLAPVPITWDYEYTADAEPDTVGWNIVENAVGDLASASGGFLTLDTTPEDAHWWYNYDWAASNAIGATFESRMKVVSNSQFGIINWLRDGTYYEGIKFYTDKIEMHIDTFNKHYMDTTDDFHVYRFTLKNNDYMVYVDGVLVINGTGQHTSSTGGNVCQFGDTTDTAGYEGISIWDYCRYKVSGAFPPGTDYCTSGNLTSIEIFLPNEMAWNTIGINKTEPGAANFINVSVLDGTTFAPIPGFDNLDNTAIDVSSIDPIAYPSIRLRATFVGNVTSTPVLHNWTVTWIDIISVPTGLTITNPLNGYSLILSWSPNPEPDIAKYILYFSTDNITFHSLANVSAYTFSFTHYGLDLGTTYYYKIAAGDDVPSQSLFSEVVKGTPDRDYDGDGIGDTDDPDDDNDGILDIDDPYPKNPLNYLEETVGNINTTVNDIQTKVTEIQLDIDTMNTTLMDIQSDIDFLNQTLPLKIDDISAELSEINDSLTTRVSDAEINILDYLKGLNASLSDDIQNLLMSITNDIISMNSSLSDQLLDLMNGMTTEHDALQQWLDIVLGELDSNLTATNDTLHKQMNDLDNLVTGFFDSLTTDIGDINTDLQLHDQNTGQDHSDIITLLNDLLDGQIEKEKIAELRTMLIDLAENLTEHDQSIADDIMDVVSDIDEFETEADRQLEDINTTLEDLEKLEDVIADLEALDQSLDQAEEDIQDSIDERSTKDEDEERFFVLELLLIIVFVLLIVNMLLTILMGKRKKGEGPSVPPPVEQSQEPRPPAPPSGGEGPKNE